MVVSDTTGGCDLNKMRVVPTWEEEWKYPEFYLNICPARPGLKELCSILKY